MITYIPLEYSLDGKLLDHTNILHSSCQFIVNTVNCQGVMGKGLALLVKRRYPSVYRHYRGYCDQGKMKPGEILRSIAPDGKIILNAATKYGWHHSSNIEWIEAILLRLRERIQDGTITSLALPPLGCGNGKLPWSEVGPLLARYLDDVPIDVECYINPRMVEYHIEAEV